MRPMFGLQLNTFDRDAVTHGDPAWPYVRSYLGMRLAIGLLGLTLPVLLVVVDKAFVDTDRPVRGSMSAYYHSSARDVFVGGLVATGLFLMTYMTAKRRTYDYVISTIGGLLLIVIALLPTARAGTELGVGGFEAGAESCTTYAGPPSCNGFQDEWGERAVQVVHQVSAGTFVVLLAVLCVVFALREFGYGRSAKALLGPARGVTAVRAELRRRRVGLLTYLWKGTPCTDDELADGSPAPRRRVLTYLLAAVVILLSAAWALLGVSVSIPFVHGPVGSTYVGEFGAFVAFGLAWLTSAWDLMPRRIKDAGARMAGMVDAVSGSEARAGRT